ncbi:ImmA/IrrE family metallo-endopeptidase [Sulfoacidibacillus thermotolerans]|uniref:IrrE N-terminal-like domain-containing protein n=1 Tax=Sulfoacidibacillus thermotolerans TaxID=1765684 RepID=A0A2U3D6T5_SULT2|nr:ImmA/IrrE family metallo-endopeptidase [Sulfoacidibacillus thermotolerans]PWI56963.1 hypothetical protein BM613_11205 [Sulfoacidibacillus thermotolerans]
MSRARETARAIARKFATDNPYQVAEQLEFKVKIKDLPSSVRGFTTAIFGIRFLVINNALDATFAKFVCAHELGHAILHPDCDYFEIKDTLFPIGKYEREAEEFAISFLSSFSAPEYGEPLERFYRRIGIPVAGGI